MKCTQFVEKAKPAALDERFELMRGDWESWEHGYKKSKPELLDKLPVYFGVKDKELEE